MSNYNTTSATTAPSTVIGINSQPYRSYLNDRSHLYHSTLQTSTTSTFNSHPNPTSTSTTSGTTASGAANHTTDSANTRTSAGQLNSSRMSLNSTNSNRGTLQLKGPPVNNKNTEYKSTDYYDDEDDEYSRPSACSRCFFGLLWCLAQIGLWGSIGIFIYWIYKFDKGLAWQNDKQKQFNLHALLMMTGFVFVNGQSMLIYKTYVCCKRIYNKILHAIFFVLSISMVSFGVLIAIQAQHNTALPDQKPVHFYSLHSWIGLVTCGLFGLQFFFGFITFLVLLCCDRATAGYRARFLPTHVTFGLVIYVLAIATCFTGLLQMARSRLSGPTATDPTRPDYKDMEIYEYDYNIFKNAGLVINTVGGCLIFLAVLIPVMVRNFNYRRPQLATSFRINHS